MIAIVTGSHGLIGAEAVLFFAEKGFTVIGIDNDMRAYFFGKEATTSNNLKKYKTRLVIIIFITIKIYATMNQFEKFLHNMEKIFLL